MYFVAKPNEEAKAFIQSTGLTDETQMKAVGTLVFDLKNYNLWDKMKAIYPMVGQPDVSSSFEFNLKNPNQFRGTFTSGWIFASTGVKGNGSSTYFDTNFNLFNNLSADNNNVTIYSRSNFNSTSTDYIGGDFAGAKHFIQLRYSNTLYMQSITPEIGVSNDNSEGFYQMNRQSSTLVKVIKNNTILTTSSNNIGAASLNNANAFVGVFLNNGVLSNYSNKEYCFLTLGDGLTDTEASNLYTAVQRFQTTLGRQV